MTFATNPMKMGLSLDTAGRDGSAVLAEIMNLAEQAIEQLKESSQLESEASTSVAPHKSLRAGDSNSLPRNSTGSAAVARLRGTGPGVSFQKAVDVLESAYPVELQYPFENNARVGGAIWPGTLIESSRTHALMKLRWEAGANDLPMHTHEHSDRFIIVLRGRGFFHVGDGTADQFTGSPVRTIAARERDVFVFSRGTMHTFSTFGDSMELLSCHLPFIPLDDPRQYTLPKYQWTASDRLAVHSTHSVELQGWADLKAM